MRDFDLSEIQAQAILDLRLSRLTKLAREEIQAEFKTTCRSASRSCGRSSAYPARIDGVIKEELLELKEIYGKSDDRRTEIVSGRGRAGARGPDQRRRTW